MANHFVIVIAGPPGVGKTTISKMLSAYFRCAYLSEDAVAQEVFPETYVSIENYPDQLKIAERTLLQKAKNIFDRGESVVMDRVNLGKESIEETRKAFYPNLIIKVLWAPVDTIMDRDQNRAGWSSGQSVIKRFYEQYEALKPMIQEEHYLDNSHQTPAQTLEELIGAIEAYKKTGR